MTTLESDTKKVIRTFNLELIVVMSLIFVIGVFTLYSATKGPGLELYQSQLIRFGVGLFLAGILVFVDPQILARVAYPFYGLCLILLLCVLFFGHVGGGSQRWLNLGLFHLQPSETAKLAIVFVFARYFSLDKSPPPYTLRQLIIPAIILAPAFVLIALQPDVGTAGVLFLSAASMVLLLKLHWRSWVILILIGVVTVPLAYRFGLKDYQRQRVKTFLDPGSDPRGSGYNALQSRIAVGSGQLYGKGYLKGTQAQLNFIPEQHTDFIFSVLAEEHGFIGSFILLFLYFLYFAFALKTVAQARDKFEMLLAFGMVAIFFWHVFINIGMVVGLLPIVGVTLPFMSWGGTSLLTFMISTALILNISRKRYIF